MSLLRSLSWAAGGLAVSPALEYAWHAWIAHSVGKRGLGRVLSKRNDPTRAAHLEHHRTAHTEGDPWKEIRENAPRIAGTTMAVAAVLTPLLGPSRAIGLAAGLGTGYVAITLAHNRMHERGPESPFEDWMWRFHFHHHYADSKVNFGLTSPVFDYVFGTAVDPPEVVIPRGNRPSWWERDRAAGERAGFRVRA